MTITVSLMAIKFITYSWLLWFQLSLCQYHKELDLKKCGFLYKIEESVQTKGDEVTTI